MSTNRDAFEQPDVVEFYRTGDLLPVERVLFDRHVPAGSRILDLGVGAGRTVAALSEGAATYIASDYATGMVDACRQDHPGVDVRVIDATDLSAFDDGSFDVVVFSFNGIDCLDDGGRRRCLEEVRRVLAADGVFIFSRHHARCLYVAPVHREVANWKIALVRHLKAIRSSIVADAYRVHSRALWRGWGTFSDRVHGGLALTAATPSVARRELAGAGLRLVEPPVAFDHPRPLSRWRTSWYYMVAAHG